MDKPMDKIIASSDAQVAPPIFVDPKEQYAHFQNVRLQDSVHSPVTDGMNTRISSDRAKMFDLASELKMAYETNDWKTAQAHFYKTINIADHIDQEGVRKDKAQVDSQLKAEAGKYPPDRNRIYELVGETMI